MTRRRTSKTDAGLVYGGAPPKVRLVRNPCTTVVRLDTAKIRDNALKAFTKAERALDQLKSELKVHEERDVPDFKSWMHRTFSTILTQHRELMQAIKDKEALLFEIQDVALRFDLSDAEAYRKAIFRRANPEAAEEEDRIFYEEERRLEEARQAAREKQRKKGRHSEDNFLDDIFGPDKDDFETKEEWEEFSDFMEDMTGFRPPPRPDAEPWQKQPPPANSREARDVYRNIVRQLHPDANGQMDESRASLWHEAQEAYRRNDVAALHSIQGRCNGDDRPGKHSPVGLILAMTQHLKKSMRSMRTEIQQAKHHPAWDFRKRQKDPAYARRIRHQLDEDTWRLNHQLKAITHELTDLERLATRVPPKHRPKRRPSSW